MGLKEDSGAHGIFAKKQRASNSPAAYKFAVRWNPHFPTLVNHNATIFKLWPEKI